MKHFKVMCLLTLGLIVPTHAYAQGALVRGYTPIPRAPDVAPSYGTAATSYLTLAPWAWQPGSSLTTYEWDINPALGLHRTSTMGTIFFVAPFALPSGALITAVRYQACDTNPGAEAHFLIEQMFAAGGFNQIDVGGTGGAQTPGCQEFVFTLMPPITVNNATESYVLLTDMQAADASVILGTARVAYKLQVSPDPMGATFTDVPVGHPFHRFVEALAASGITGGCGGGLYCPDQPVTRGQMAVFLSAALGLHWAP